MNKALAFLIPILAIVAVGAAAGEDRTETIADSKGSKELVYRNDVLAEERTYDARGAILEERLFDASALPIETRIYIRDGGRIVKVEATDASGNPSGAMTYRYDRFGRLLGVSSEGSLGLGSAGMIASQGRPQGAWFGRAGADSPAAAGTNAGVSDGATTTVLGYDESGRPAIIQTVRGGAAVSIEKRSYGAGGALASVQTEDKVTGLSSDSVYDEKGRVSARTDTPSKGLQAKTEFHYDDAGRLSEELSSQGGHRSSKTYVYAKDGKVSREETRKDGELLLVVSYIENGRVEELYEDGSVFVKATIIGGRKIKDEFYADGVIVRTRDY